MKKILIIPLAILCLFSCGGNDLGITVLSYTDESGIDYDTIEPMFYGDETTIEKDSTVERTFECVNDDSLHFNVRIWGFGLDENGGGLQIQLSNSFMPSPLERIPFKASIVDLENNKIIASADSTVYNGFDYIINVDDMFKNVLKEEYVFHFPFLVKIEIFDKSFLIPSFAYIEERYRGKGTRL